MRVYDPWLPASTIADHGAKATALDDILAKSDTVFVTASVTADNQHLFDARAFASMKPGAAFVLLSRAGIVDFDAMREAAASGHIKVATDVFPEEPPAADDPSEARRTCSCPPIAPARSIAFSSGWAISYSTISN